MHRCLSPSDVTARALAGSDEACVEARSISSSRCSESVAGDLALTLGARGGVYLGGGIVTILAIGSIG